MMFFLIFNVLYNYIPLFNTMCNRTITTCPFCKKGEMMSL